MDVSLNVLKGVCSNHEYIRVVNLSRNFGQHLALLAGFEFV